ncbi:MAG: hypothetical protein LJE97_00465 [Betaproteobacteria bacterium]|jgi:hypothetical protein|nr:hypothetical protein [Betaproteobacteria bacterium]
MTTRYPGLLTVWNDITAADEAEFNAWYDEEHFPERLGVPGFLTARRYRDVSAPQRYAAIYDTTSVDVFTSPAYLERLANPTPRTRAIMPRFSNMTRAACEVVADFGEHRAPGSVVAWLELAGPPADSARDALAAAASVGRIRVALPHAKSTQVPNPEAKFRQAPDRLPPPFVLVEGDDERAVSAAAERIAPAIGALRPTRLFRLLLAQEA